MPVRKRNNSYEYYFNIGKVDKKYKRITKGGFKTKKEAEEAEALARAEYLRTEKIQNNSKMLYEEYLNYYVENYLKETTRWKTNKNYSNIIEKHIIPFFGNYKLKDITTKDIYDFCVLKSKDYSKTYTQQMLNVLSSSFNYAIFPCAYIENNPCGKLNIKSLHFKETEKVEITKEDVDKIIDYLSIRNEDFIIVIKILYHTGCRIGECIALTWDDIDFENKKISITKQLQSQEGGKIKVVPPKTESSIRDVYFDDILCDALIKQKKLYDLRGLKHNYVCFDKKGKIADYHYCHNNLGRINRDVCRLRFHALRHLHCTMLLEAGANVKYIATRLGHSRVQTTLDIYASVTKKGAVDTMKLFESML